MIHQMRVSRELSEHGDEPVLREVQTDPRATRVLIKRVAPRRTLA